MIVIKGIKANGEQYSREIEKSILTLNLKNNQLASIDLSPLKACTKLQRLKLNGNRLASIDLSPLKDYTKLQELELSNNQLASIDLSPLKACTKLQRLKLNGNRLASIDLSPLKDYTELKSLELASNKLTSIDFSPLKACTELQGVGLSYNQLASIDLSPLKECTKLQRVGLFGNQLASIDLSPLKECTELQGVGLFYNQLASIDLSPLKECTKLYELELSNNQLASIDLSPLNKCTELQWLRLYDNQLASIDLSPLKECTKLQRLRLANNQLASIDLSPLKEWTELKSLELASNKLTSFDLSPLKACTELQWLGLTNNQLKRLDVTALKKCTKLEKLGVDANVTLFWREEALPKKYDLPKGLQEHYTRLIIGKQPAIPTTIIQRLKVKNIDEIEDADKLLDLGDEYFETGKRINSVQAIEQAIECYQKAVDIKPDFHEAWNNMGLAYKNLWNFDQAIDCLQKTVELKPDDHEAWFDMGYSYSWKGEHDQDIKCYQKAVDIKPDFHEAWIYLGRAYNGKGEFAEAIKCYQKAVTIKPDDHGAWYSIGNAYSNMGEFDKAIEYYRKVLEIHPDSDVALISLSVLEKTSNLSKEIETTKDELNIKNIEFEVIQSIIKEKEEKKESIPENIQQTKVELLIEISSLKLKNEQKDMELDELKKQIQLTKNTSFQTLQADIMKISAVAVQAIEDRTHLAKTRVLILAADPIYQSRLEDCEEVRLIKDQLMKKEVFYKPIIEVAFRKKDLVGFITKYTPNVIHFIGHGGFDGELKIKSDIEDDNEESKDDYISPKVLVEVFKLLEEELKCVFLNACYTDETAELVKNSADCVIGIKGKINDDIARYFAEGFYNGSIEENNVLDAIKVGKVQAFTMLENEYASKEQDLNQELKKIVCLKGRKHPAEVYLAPLRFKNFKE